MTKRAWKTLKRFPDGHTYFVLKDAKDLTKVYIADHSGATPDETSDGPLYIDKRGIIANWKFAHLQVLSESGRKSTTAIGFDEALWLAARLSLSIEAPGMAASYSVTLQS
ncbi:MAG: hypothetical protein WC869_01170 [Phycisphaerae bacterium]|jgi:hypothetical protein